MSKKNITSIINEWGALMIDTTRTLTANDSFQKAEYVVMRMYPLLDGFSVETSGLYIYLRSWRMNDPEDPMFGRVWLNREEIYAQTGIGRKVFERHLDGMIRYGLVETEKSTVRTNKLNFVVKEPLTEAEFRARYPREIERFTERLREIQEKNRKDEAQFPKKQAKWKADRAVEHEAVERTTGKTAGEILRSRVAAETTKSPTTELMAWL
jgi:hypothetical protein